MGPREVAPVPFTVSFPQAGGGSQCTHLSHSGDRSVLLDTSSGTLDHPAGRNTGLADHTRLQHNLMSARGTRAVWYGTPHITWVAAFVSHVTWVAAFVSHVTWVAAFVSHVTWVAAFVSHVTRLVL